MPTSSECSESTRSRPGQTLQDLQRRVERVVERVMSCPKNQTDSAIRNLRNLWKERSVLVVGDEALPHVTTATGPGRVNH